MKAGRVVIALAGAYAAWALWTLYRAQQAGVPAPVGLLGAPLTVTAPPVVPNITGASLLTGGTAPADLSALVNSIVGDVRRYTLPAAGNAP